MILVKYLSDDAPRDLRWLLRDDPDAGLAAYAQALRDGWYSDAARIDSDDLEHAYTLMQNGVVSESWTLEPPAGLTPLLPPIVANGRTYGNRSAMIGDLFEQNGQWFVCLAIGFQALPPDMIVAPGTADPGTASVTT